MSNIHDKHARLNRLFNRIEESLGNSLQMCLKLEGNARQEELTQVQMVIERLTMAYGLYACGFFRGDKGTPYVVNKNRNSIAIAYNINPKLLKEMDDTKLAIDAELIYRRLDRENEQDKAIAPQPQLETVKRR